VLHWELYEQPARASLLHRCTPAELCEFSQGRRDNGRTKKDTQHVDQTSSKKESKKQKEI